jgi:hypothetical protein
MNETINTCDNLSFFESVVQSAIRIGFLHIGTGQARVNSNKLITILGTKHGRFGYRRFHQESLNRAYGIAFTAASKLSYAKERGL